jgi:hypothetical protein
MSKISTFALLGCFCLSPAWAETSSLTEANRIAKAECSETGVRVTYDNNARIEIPTGGKTHNTCQELKVSADRKVAAWVIACTGVAINGNGEGTQADGSSYQAICARLSGLTAGKKTFNIEDLSAFIGELAFKGRTHHLIYRSASMHGHGVYFLYDLDNEKPLLACGEGDNSPRCAELTKER